MPLSLSSDHPNPMVPVVFDWNYLIGVRPPVMPLLLPPLSLSSYRRCLKFFIIWSWYTLHVQSKVTASWVPLKLFNFPWNIPLHPLCSLSTIRFRQGAGVQSILRKGPLRLAYKTSEGIKRHKNCYVLLVPIFFQNLVFSTPGRVRNKYACAAQNFHSSESLSSGCAC